MTDRAAVVRRALFRLAPLAGLALAACGTPQGERPAGPTDPARSDLGRHTYRVTTSSPEAQRAFDRGLTLAYAFNHGAAEKEFRRAAEADPECAMAWWGVALVNGPHINNPAVPPEAAARAWEALGKARALAPKGSETERALIDALGKRYASPQPEDRRPLDEAYAAAMGEVWKAHPSDADVAALYAEAMMDLRPWDLWTHDGKPQPGTEEILATLERALELDAKHPMANHLYVHATEASPHPERGTAAADMLRDLVPGAGHLVHMPAHIYVRTGRWADSEAANLRAIEADAAFRATNPRPGFYNVYMAHNPHFIAFTGMMEGRSSVALEKARAMVAAVPRDFLDEYAAVIDGYLAAPIEVLVRFGRWDDVLAEPEPAEKFPIARAMRLFARATALTALGRMEEAEREREAFRKAAASLPDGAAFGNNGAADLMRLASNVLDGEMAAKRERWDEAVAALRAAAAAEDGLRYDEPPDWIQPVRHSLGAVLLRAGRAADAESVYREDLVRFPENGWSLFGLGRALRIQKKDAEAAEVEARFEKAWARADVKIGSTCYCQPGV